MSQLLRNGSTTFLFSSSSFSSSRRLLFWSDFIFIAFCTFAKNGFGFFWFLLFSECCHSDTLFCWPSLKVDSNALNYSSFTMVYIRRTLLLVLWHSVFSACSFPIHDNRFVPGSVWHRSWQQPKFFLWLVGHRVLLGPRAAHCRNLSTSLSTDETAESKFRECDASVQILLMVTGGLSSVGLDSSYRTLSYHHCQFDSGALPCIPPCYCFVPRVHWSVCLSFSYRSSPCMKCPKFISGFFFLAM